MNAQPRTRSRSAAPPRSSRVRALAIVATTSVIVLFGVTWVALGIAAIRQAGG